MKARTMVTWNSIPAGFSSKPGKLKEAQDLFDEIPEPDSVSYNVMLSCYFRNVALEAAKDFFDRIPVKNIASWNTMISGFSQNGRMDEDKELFCIKPRISMYCNHKALNLFDEVRNKGMKPDWITFVGVLSGCNHAGLVELGICYFEKMQKDYGITVKPDHYTCMIDLLGRASKLTEAVDLIKKMPFEPHSAICGTLLGACRIHKNLEIAEFAATNLLLDPINPAAYVQLANVYAANKKWESVSRVRRTMKENNAIKTLGCSWIEIKSVIHEFRSGDRLHHELEYIHDKLNELEKKMKLADYVPDLESALHDVAEEKKEQLLLWHSEKLAIAFGLIRVPLGLPIRVFKNLRVCEDCHLAIKFISALEGREIFVRDTTRFHHFQDGKYSCGDCW
ncbi:hypothetical protein Pfo_010892 [Paulownia fortunei]|nr:hypothetical protein Pfo_010892 [Paulownia fortunei]